MQKYAFLLKAPRNYRKMFENEDYKRQVAFLSDQ